MVEKEKLLYHMDHQTNMKNHSEHPPGVGDGYLGRRHVDYLDGIEGNNVQRKLNLHLMLQVQSRQNILTIIAAYIESGVVHVKRNLMAEDFLIQVRRPLIRTMRSGGVLEKETKLDILQKYPTAWLMVIEQLRNHQD